MKTLLPLAIAFLVCTSTIAQSLSGVESVEYDPDNNRYLASSDGNAIVAIAPNGGLSHFGVGTTADYGMEVMNGTLFAIAGTSIKGYDLTTENEVMSLNIGGAIFLNGMASNGVDKLWVSDFNGYDIYEVDVSNFASPSFVNVVDQTDLGTSNKPNGLVYDGANNRVLIAGWGSDAPIRAMDLTSYAVTDVVSNTGLGNIDGIDYDDDGNWFISSWSPNRITKYSNDFSSSEIITVPGISNPADICYSTETDTLAIPGGSQILFVGFEESTVGVTEENFETHQIYYQSGYPVIEFELNQVQDVTLEILNTRGQLVYKVLEGKQPAGLHKVVTSSIGLCSKAYICRLVSKEVSFSERIIIQ